jgi:hypothetical protein
VDSEGKGTVNDKLTTDRYVLKVAFWNFQKCWQFIEQLSNEAKPALGIWQLLSRSVN